MINVAKSVNQNMLFMSNKVGEIGKKCSVSSYKENKQKAYFKPCASKRNCVPNPKIENPHKHGREKKI